MGVTDDSAAVTWQRHAILFVDTSILAACEEHAPLDSSGSVERLLRQPQEVAIAMARGSTSKSGCLDRKIITAHKSLRLYPSRKSSLNLQSIFPRANFTSLTPDLQERILIILSQVGLLPFKLRLVCKTWNSLIVPIKFSRWEVKRLDENMDAAKLRSKAWPSTWVY